VKNIRLNIYTALTLAISFSGCVVYNPIAEYSKQRYTNAIAYFNTYYNAQRLFNDAEDEVFKSRRDYFERGQTTKAFVVPSSARQKFQTSIEKNSRVLSFYADSKWVDDALLMIGKAYFYMDDDVRAERKFQELAVQFPQSEVIFESQLWLGKSLMRQKKYSEGIKQLEEVFAKTIDHDEEIAGQSAFELGEHYFQLEDYQQAEKQYGVAVELVDDDETKTRIYFQIGRSFNRLKNNEKAQEAYLNAAAISPIYTFKFQAQLQFFKSTALQLKYDEAINGLNEMLSDTKNKEFFGIVHFEIANVLMLQNKTSEAINKYIFVDTAFARTDEAARSYYILGKYFEEKELNYDSARTLYNKARSEFTSSEITKEATERSDIFNKYDILQKDLIRYDSLYINALLMKDQQDSLALIKQSDTTRIKDSVSVKEEPKVKKMTKAGKADPKKDSTIVIDSTKIKDQLDRTITQQKMVDSLYRSIIRTKFELGGLFYVEIQQPDSALRLFNEVVNKYSASEFAPRALYSIAEIQRSIKQKPKSELDSLYTKIITSYPESPYANEARKSLGLPLVEAQKDSAQEEFEQAEKLSDSKKYESAIVLYKRISDQFLTSTVSAKSLFTAGWHYENSLMNNDSAYAVYKRVITKYPLSQFANFARPKVTEYENELKRIEQEKQKIIEEQKLKEEQEKEAKSPKTPKTETAPQDSLPTPKNKL